MDLAQAIRSAVRAGNYLVGDHGRRRLKRRKIALWQIETGLDTGVVVKGRPKSKPNPSIVVKETLVDGTNVGVVWSWLAATKRAKLATVFFPRRGGA